MEVCFFYLKYCQISIKIYQITNFLIFCWNFILQLRKSKSTRLRLQKILWKHFSKVLTTLYLWWFVSYFLDAWWRKNSMLKFVYFIGNVIKFPLRSIKISNFLLFGRNFSQNVDFESKNLSNEACDFDDEHIFGKLRCNSIKWYTFDYAFDPQRLWNTDFWHTF